MPINVRKNKYILILVFFIIPYFCLLLSYNALADFSVKWRQLTLQDEVKANYLKIKHEGDHLSYLSKQLNQSYGILSEDRLARENIAKSIEIIRNLGLDFFKLRFFDHKGEIIVIPGEDQDMRLILKNIFQALVEPEVKGTQTLLKRNHAYINALLGSVAPAELISEKSNLMEVTIKGEKGYFYWNTFYTADENKNFQGGMFAWCLAREVPEHFSIKNIIDEINTQKFGSERWGILNFHEPELSYPAIGHFEESRLFLLFKEMHKNQEMRQNLGNRALFLFPLGKNRWLFCVKTSHLGLLSQVGFILLILLSVYLIFEIKKFLLWEKELIVGWGGLRGVLGLGFLVLLGLGLLWAGKGAVLELARGELRGQLDELELGYNGELGQLEGAYERLIDASRSEKGLVLGSHLEEAYQQGLYENFYVFSSKGSLKYLYPKSLGLDLMVQLLQPVVKQIFSSLSSNTKSFAKQLQDSFYQKVSQDMLASLDGASELMRSLERLNGLNEFWLLNKKYYVYSSLVKGSGAKEPLLVMFWHKNEKYGQRYLHKEVAKLRKKSVGLFIMDLSKDGAPYPIDFNRYSFPREIKRRVLESGVGQGMLVKAGFEQFYVLGTVMRGIPNKLVVGLMPYEKVAAEYVKLCWALVMAMLSFLAGFILKK
jgi:hypothetical protein